MNNRTMRATPVDLEIRGADGRTLCGIVAPFNQPAKIVDYDGQYIETIDRGAFDRTISERGPARVKLLCQHDSKTLPIGRATTLRPEASGLYGELRVSETDLGEQVLTLVRDQALDGLSIGFRTIRERWSPDRKLRHLLEIRLDEISVVNFPAYETARVLAVRSATQPNLLAARRRLLESRNMQ